MELIENIEEFLPVFHVVDNVHVNSQEPINDVEIINPTNNQLFPDEINDYDQIYEGARKKVFVNVYERNTNIRDKCIEHFGCVCQVCGLDFEEKYGILGRGFIHVHHLIPLYEIGEKYKIKPKEDLIPVCPNCHAMLHRRKNTQISIDYLKKIIKRK